MTFFLTVYLFLCILFSLALLLSSYGAFYYAVKTRPTDAHGWRVWLHKYGILVSACLALLAVILISGACIVVDTSLRDGKAAAPIAAPSHELKSIGELKVDANGFVETEVGQRIRFPVGQNLQVLKVRPNGEFVCAFPADSPPNPIDEATMTKAGGEDTRDGPPPFRKLIVRVKNPGATACNGVDNASFLNDISNGSLEGKCYCFAIREEFRGREREIVDMRALFWSTWLGKQSGPAVMIVDGSILRLSKGRIVPPAAYNSELMDLN